MRLRCLCPTLLLVLCAAAPAAAAPPVRFSATLDPAVGGTLAAPNPVAAVLDVGIGTNAAPTPARELAVALPAGFRFTGADAPACDQENLGVKGPASCPQGSQLATGEASYTYLPTTLRIRGKTDAMALYNGGGGKLLLYLHTRTPTELTFVLPGTATAGDAAAGPLLSFDLRDISDAPYGVTAVTAVTLKLPRAATTPAPSPAATKKRPKAYKACRRRDGKLVCFTCRGRGAKKRCVKRKARRATPRQTPPGTTGAIAAGPCPDGGRWALEARFLFSDASRASAVSEVACTRAAAATPGAPPPGGVCGVLAPLCPPPVRRDG